MAANPAALSKPVGVPAAECDYDLTHLDPSGVEPPAFKWKMSTRHGKQQQQQQQQQKNGSDQQHLTKRDGRRSKLLERNRIAASNCRQKKRERMRVLEESAAKLEVWHATLQTEFKRLQNEVTLIKNSLIVHANCNDANIARWVESEALRFVQEFTCSSTSRGRNGSNAQPSPSGSAGMQISSPVCETESIDHEFIPNDILSAADMSHLYNCFNPTQTIALPGDIECSEASFASDVACSPCREVTKPLFPVEVWHSLVEENIAATQNEELALEPLHNVTGIEQNVSPGPPNGYNSLSKTGKTEVQWMSCVVGNLVQLEDHLRTHTREQLRAIVSN